MANLQETDVWVDGIYQLETTDPMRSRCASMGWSRQLTSR